MKSGTWLERPAVAAALLLLLTLVAYSRAIPGGFVWDDDDYVTENVTLRSDDGLRRIWTEPGAVPQYYPMVHTSYWIEYRLWGLDPTGYGGPDRSCHRCLITWSTSCSTVSRP